MLTSEVVTEPINFTAPCPDCGQQMERVSHHDEPILYCHACEKAFGLWDKRLELSKEAPAKPIKRRSKK